MAIASPSGASTIATRAWSMAFFLPAFRRAKSMTSFRKFFFWPCRLHGLRDVSCFGAWLGTITRNRANDYFRKAIPNEKVTEPVDENHAESRAANSAAEQEAAMVLSVVRGLPDAYREPLILRLVEGMTGPEIAARTGLTHGSVRVNLYRGMQLL